MKIVKERKGLCPYVGLVAGQAMACTRRWLNRRTWYGYITRAQSPEGSFQSLCASFSVNLFVVLVRSA